MCSNTLFIKTLLKDPLLSVSLTQCPPQCAQILFREFAAIQIVYLLTYVITSPQKVKKVKL